MGELVWVTAPVDESHRGTRSELLRRTLNVGVATVAILVCLPLMLVIALCIKVSSPGPVLFTQPRVGMDRRNGAGLRQPVRCRRSREMGGRLFRIYKFRTMTVQAPGAREVWASPEDPRITGVGRVLRRYRLDELPQLVNVLRGEMNLVGPRPEQPAIFQQLRAEIPGYRLRQRVLPGITGLAQVRQGYDQSMEDVAQKLQHDLEYVRDRSPLMDLGIMLRTVPVMALGADGVGSTLPFPKAGFRRSS